jgi:hypothetical protein
LDLVANAIRGSRRCIEQELTRAVPPHELFEAMVDRRRGEQPRPMELRLGLDGRSMTTGIGVLDRGALKGRRAIDTRGTNGTVGTRIRPRGGMSYS